MPTGLIRAWIGLDSRGRQAVKRVLYPIANESVYRVAQAVAKAWDIRTRRWYESEIDLVPLAVRRGETALDIGANFGLYTYHLSRAVGASGRVYAFEPVPFTTKTFRLIMRLLSLRNVELTDKGCGDVNGRVTFRVPVQAFGAMSVGLTHLATRDDDRAGKETQVRWARTREIECDVVALDDFLAAPGVVSLIKCDIEGGELLALRGARRIIDRHRPTVIIEINPWYLEGLGIRLEDLTAFFFERGYAIYRYEGGTLRAVAVGEIVEDNYVCIHPSRRDRFTGILSRRQTV
jgi:FkbM family methyltransferase